MYIKKINFVIYLALAAAVGFGLSFLLIGLGVESALSSGDISMASKHASPAMSAFQEKVTNDSTELNKARASLTVLTSLMAEFDELVSVAATASEGKDELASSLEQLLRIKQIASNARDNGVMALESLNAIAEGKKTSINYELASQNLSLAFLMVDRQVSIGKQYVCDVDAYLDGKDIAGYKDLASARDLWAGYCAREAILNKDGEELDYWSKKEYLLSSESGKYVISDPDISADNRIAMAGNLDRSLQYLNMASELSSSVDVNQMMQNVLPGAGTSQYSSRMN